MGKELASRPGHWGLSLMREDDPHVAIAWGAFAQRDMNAMLDPHA